MVKPRKKSQGSSVSKSGSNVVTSASIPTALTNTIMIDPTVAARRSAAARAYALQGISHKDLRLKSKATSNYNAKTNPAAPSAKSTGRKRKIPPGAANRTDWNGGNSYPLDAFGNATGMVNRPLKQRIPSFGRMKKGVGGLPTNQKFLPMAQPNPSIINVPAIVKRPPKPKGKTNTFYPPPIAVNNNYDIDENDEYAKFVRSLSANQSYPSGGNMNNPRANVKSNSMIPPEDEDEDAEEYNSDDMEEDDMEDEKDILRALEFSNSSSSALITPKTPSPGQHPVNHQLDQAIQNSWLDSEDPELFHANLEAELGSLLEEDLEAAVSTLLATPDNAMGKNRKSSAGSTHNRFHTGPQGNKRIPTTPASSPGLLSGSSSFSFTPEKEGTSNSVPSSSTVIHPPPTEEQIAQLTALMSEHYQILLQQSILAVRAAHINKLSKENPSAMVISHEHEMDSSKPQSRVLKSNNFFFGTETADDLAEILDGAVGMLQDLDQNRKDSIRYSIQMQRTRKKECTSSKGICNRNIRTDVPRGNLGVLLPTSAPTSARSIVGMDVKNIIEDDITDVREEPRLTRSAFTRSLKETEMNEIGINRSTAQEQAGWTGGQSPFPINTSTVGLASVRTTFGVKGLKRLKETFEAIDSSVYSLAVVFGSEATHASNTSCRSNILGAEENGDACELLLRVACADYDRNLIPGYQNLANILSYPSEISGSTEQLTKNQETQLRKSKSQFTAAEDNLLLRGVNLYGEKEWLLISDRFLPDRSFSVISQRYARVCLLIYKASGVNISDDGCLDTPAVHPNGVDDFDEEAILKLKPVEAPASFNVHRWGLEEDISLLNAVPLMGHMWAEVANRLMPHRDRGHLRKRYQVLERRVRATFRREKKTTILQKEKANYTGASKDVKNNQTTQCIKEEENSGNIEIVSTSIKVPSHERNIGFVHPQKPSSIPVNKPNIVTKSKVLHPNTSLPVSKIQSSAPIQIMPSNGHCQPKLFNGPNKMTNNLKQAQFPKKELHNFHCDNGSQRERCARKSSAFRTSNIIEKKCKIEHVTAPSRQESLPSKTLLSSSNSVLHPSECINTQSLSDNTQLGFSKMLDDGWSQMSSVRRLIEGNESSTAKFKIDNINNEYKHQLNNSFSVHATESLPNLKLDSNSGLSLLVMINNTDDVSKVKPGNESLQNKSQSIMSSVLKRAKGTSPHVKLPIKSTLPTSKYPVLKGFINNPTASFPASSNNMNSTLGSNTLLTNTITGCSMDAFTLSNFTLSEESKKAFDKLPRSSPIQGDFPQPFINTHSSVLGCNSLMQATMEATDLDAITALNQMSNSSVQISPFKRSLRKPTNSKQEKSSSSDKSCRTSLFSKVLGSIKDLKKNEDM